MQALISQVLLPLTLALVMFAMGLGLSLKDFKHVFSRPRLALTGLSLQLIGLPLLALLLISAMPLVSLAAAGLFLLALSPGGATSNLFSWLAKGNVALSISLTAISSLIVPFSLPLLFGLFMQTSGKDVLFSFPLGLMIKQLIVVTLLPVILGMLCHAYLSRLSRKLEPLIKQLATGCMFAVIVALVITNLHIVNAMLSIEGVTVLLLSTLSLMLGYLLSRQLGFEPQVNRTLGIETGVQNAGTAMLVSLSILQQPALASVPLMYGLLMNVPVFIFIGYCRYQARIESRQLLQSSH